jgi:circadian clock protein KaiC
MSNSDRTTTGVAGLDDVLGGGLLSNQVYLLEGEPGTGKTTLALQFLLAGRARGDTGLYITLSESKAELAAMAASHGWSLDGISLCELIPTEAHLSPESQYTFFHPEEVELHETVQALIREVETVRPARLIIDSLAELRLLALEPQRYRRQALALKRYFENGECTVLLLDDRTTEMAERQLHSIVHGVITLERLTRAYGKNRRRLEIAKLRGSPFVEGFHDYTIETGGLRVFPRLISAVHPGSFERDAISSTVPELDELLGGGLDRGSSTLILGPAGAGKTTLATRYATAAIDRGERVAFYTFDEGLGSLLVRSAGLAMELEEDIANGRILVQQVDPAELSPGEFASRVRSDVEQGGVRMIVIDSLNGYLSAMPEEQFLTLQMHELLSFLNQQGIATILVLAQQGLLGPMQNPVDVSYLADTILLLRFFEAHGEVRRALSVVKRRSSHHERTIRELQIGGGTGIHVGAPLYEFRGVLTGVPEYIGLSQSAVLDESDGKRG